MPRVQVCLCFDLANIRKSKVKLFFSGGGKKLDAGFIVTFVCIILDILSIVALNNRDILPETFVKFLCKSYLVTLLGVAFCGLLYVCVDIYAKKKEYRKKVHKYEFAALVGTLLIYALPIDYRFAEDGVHLSILMEPVLWQPIFLR